MQLTRGRCAVIPWTPTARDPGMETVLVEIWRRLREEELYAIVFHEASDMTLAQFIGFFSRTDVAPQVLGEVNTHGMLVDLAGITWLSSIESLSSGVVRAIGSFAYFRKFWKPEWTDVFGELVLRYWFDGLGLGLLTAVTPSPNRAARLYAKRLGVPYVAHLHNYSSFSGKPCDVDVALLDSRRFSELYPPIGD